MGRHSPFQLHSGGRVIATRLLLLALALGAGYLVFEYGRIHADYDIVEAGRERQEFEDHIAMLEAEIASRNEEIVKLETDRAIDRESYKDVEANLVTLRAKIQEQADAIAFYRGIVSPADGAAGLKVQDLKLTRTSNERAYNVRLVLVQSLKHDRKVSGNIGLSVHGVQDGNEVSYPLNELLAGPDSGDWPFSFRYFQNFEGEIVLPDGFTPERIKIEVRSKTRSIASIEESFSWATSPG